MSVSKLLNSISNETRRSDCKAVLKLMKKVTKMTPKVWGPSFIGFGSFHYQYESGREGDNVLAGFSLRKQNLVIYIPQGCDQFQTTLKRLGKHKTGKVCLYINKLEDIDFAVLEELIKRSFAQMLKRHKNKLN